MRLLSLLKEIIFLLKSSSNESNCKYLEKHAWSVWLVFLQFHTIPNKGIYSLRSPWIFDGHSIISFPQSAICIKGKFTSVKQKLSFSLSLSWFCCCWRFLFRLIFELQKKLSTYDILDTFFSRFLIITPIISYLARRLNSNDQ